ncbi:1-deoxy-D-xylulose-5-phosphate synthase [Candidatus Desantisbacteria bacterium]|nr:1-deoxy-D-xylulose-5-phosphate synthase [Candidatus Desantisbacteria bacterium]
MVLEKISSPSGLKTLTISELNKLSSEIRELIINTVSTNGGHLASSLGVVELSIAVHRIFNSPNDKIIWDVGHQAYAHKILTGRRDVFGSLRTFQGISGFPRREESPYDPFSTGHASTSISAALGMAIARDISKESYKIVAIIGDGSISGGLAFEALNHVGYLGKDMLVILNSNEMSISPTVGALSKYLNKILTAPIYNRFRKDVQELLNKVPRIGSTVADLVQRVEEGVKNVLVHGVLFEDLGLRYIGPVDGHNLPLLIETLKSVQSLNGPILLHVITKKGYGYKPAEQHPDMFHGLGQFDVATGQPKKGQGITFSEVFGKTMIELAASNPKIFAITAAMEDGTGLSEFRESFPARLLDVGIAEEHAVTLAGGMAAGGLSPVVAIYSTFLQRAYDQILHDVCMPNLPVVFCLDRAGLVGEDGATHHGVFDIAYLRHMPNMTICAPKDGTELKEMLALGINSASPFAIRYPRGKVVEISSLRGENYDNNIHKHRQECLCYSTRVEIGRAEVIREGTDAYILACGSMTWTALKAASTLEKEFRLGVINARFVKPLDIETILTAAEKTGRIITLEEHVLAGGFGSAVCELLTCHQMKTKITTLGLPDAFVEHGETSLLLKKHRLDVGGVVERIREVMGKS